MLKLNKIIVAFLFASVYFSRIELELILAFTIHTELYIAKTNSLYTVHNTGLVLCPGNGSCHSIPSCFSTSLFLLFSPFLSPTPSLSLFFSTLTHSHLSFSPFLSPAPSLSFSQLFSSLYLSLSLSHVSVPISSHSREIWRKGAMYKICPWAPH